MAEPITKEPAGTSTVSGTRVRTTRASRYVLNGLRGGYRILPDRRSHVFEVVGKIANEVGRLLP